MSQELKQVLIYDIAACPMSAGLTMEEVFTMYKQQGVVLWDSQENTDGTPVQEPKVLNVPVGIEIKVLDLSNEEGRAEIEKLNNDTKE